MASVMDYVVSFVDGRVRLRHPALREKASAELITGVLEAVEGITAVRCKQTTGSLLIYYDPEKLSREDLLAFAEQGAAFLPEIEVKGACKSSSVRKDAASVCTCGTSLLFGRNITRVANRLMLLSLLCALGGAVSGMRTLHTVAGGIFTAASLQHMAAHRKSL
jgi:hypothetical protein